jgi:hypothetical protein
MLGNSLNVSSAAAVNNRILCSGKITTIINQQFCYFGALSFKRSSFKYEREFEEIAARIKRPSSVLSSSGG